MGFPINTALKRLLLFCVAILVIYFIYKFFEPKSQPVIKPFKDKRPKFVLHQADISEIRLGKKVWCAKSQKAFQEKERVIFSTGNITFIKNKKDFLKIKFPLAELNLNSRDVIFENPYCDFLLPPRANLKSEKIFWSSKKNLIRAMGKVLLKNYNYRLNANEMFFDELANDITATDVKFISNKGVISSARSKIWLKDRKIYFTGKAELKYGDVVLTASCINFENNKISAYPKVKMNYLDKIEINANNALYYPETEEMFLEGEVFLDKRKLIGEVTTVNGWNKTYDNVTLTGRADKASFYILQNKAVMYGNTSFTSEDLSLNAQMITVLEDKIAASKSVKVQGKDFFVTSEFAEYDLSTKNVLVLSGNVKINRSGDMLRGGGFIIDLNENKIQSFITGKKNDSFQNKKGRTKIKISSEVFQ